MRLNIIMFCEILLNNKQIKLAIKRRSPLSSSRFIPWYFSIPHGKYLLIFILHFAKILKKLFKKILSITWYIISLPIWRQDWLFFADSSNSRYPFTRFPYTNDKLMLRENSISPSVINHGYSDVIYESVGKMRDDCARRSWWEGQ